MNCLLCSHTSIPFYNYRGTDYFKCSHCNSVMMDSQNHPTADEEIERYTQHNNDVNDPLYQKFVSPITSAILKDFSTEHKGLDFGCGTGPVITKLLTDQGYSVNTYDPFFDNNQNALENTYDFIVCCEVIEHFHRPLKEFQLLKSLLNPKGKLLIMTDPYYDELDFDKWYYKNDATHVFFYHYDALLWIKNNVGFSKVITENRRIIFEN